MPVYLYGVTKEGTCLVAGMLGEGLAGPRLPPLPVLGLSSSRWGPAARSGGGGEAGIPSPLRVRHKGRWQEGTRATMACSTRTTPGSLRCLRGLLWATRAFQKRIVLPLLGFLLLLLFLNLIFFSR